MLKVVGKSVCLCFTLILVACGGSSGDGTTETVQPATVPMDGTDAGDDIITGNSDSGNTADTGGSTDNGTGGGSTTDSGTDSGNTIDDGTSTEGTTGDGSGSGVITDDGTDAGSTADGTTTGTGVTNGGGDTTVSADQPQSLFSDLIPGTSVFDARNGVDGFTIDVTSTYSETDRILTSVSTWTLEDGDPFETTVDRHFNEAGEFVREVSIEGGIVNINTTIRYENGLPVEILSDFFNDGTVDSVTDFEYDESGRLVRTIATNPITGDLDAEGTRVYSDSGWSTRYINSFANTVTDSEVITDSRGRAVTLIRTFIDGSDVSVFTTTLTYDDNGSPLTTEVTNEAGEVLATSANSNIMQIADTIHDNLLWTAAYRLSSF